MFGAGPPQLAGLAGEAKSHAERLFSDPDVGRLDAVAARDAVWAPIEQEGASIAADAPFTVPMFDEFLRRTMPDWKIETTIREPRKAEKRRKPRD